jgi:hypothetical protein
MSDGIRRACWALALGVGLALLMMMIDAWPAVKVAASAPTAAPVAKTAPPAQPLLAWAVASDTGDVFVLDATAKLYRLSATDLSVVARSGVLFKTPGKAAAFLAVDRTRLFVGSETVTRTLVLRRSDFGQVTALNEAGPMAVDPDRKLFLVSRGALVHYDLKALGQPARVLIPTLKSGAYGDVPRDVVADPHGRRLYVRIYGAIGSPPHNPEFCAIYDLDTLQRTATFGQQLANLSRVTLAENTDDLAVVDSSNSGFLGSSLQIFNRQGTELRIARPLDGIPVLDAGGSWVYLLRDRGLWVLNAGDLSWRSILPFQVDAPADLALSPDGRRLYLFGNGWLAVKDTAELQSLGLPSVSPFPAAWVDDPNPFFGPAFFASPQMEQDHTAFVQVGGYAETYRTADGGKSWRFLPALTYPDFQYALHLSLSPDFAHDRTMTALTSQLHSLLRSTDAGETWEFWTPRIAFVSDRGGNRDLYTMQQDGTDVLRLTDAPYPEENPAWSPAWTHLAFQGNRSGTWDIYTMKADCGPGQDCDLRQLTDDPADDTLPAWSPDGRSIAFVSTRDGNPEVYVMDSDGANQRRLTFQPTGDWRPAWLPDSHHLVFVSDRAGDNDIYEMEVPASPTKLTAEPKVTPLVTGPADDRDPAISAFWVMAFLSDRDGTMRAYRMELGSAGSSAYAVAEPRRSVVSGTVEAEGHPSWIDDAGIHGGNLLVSIEQGGATNIHVVDYPDYDTALTSSSGFNGHPAWGPPWWRPDDKTSRAQLKPYQK